MIFLFPDYYISKYSLLKKKKKKKNLDIGVFITWAFILHGLDYGTCAPKNYHSFLYSLQIYREKEKKKKKNHLTTIEQCYNNLTLDLIHFESLGLIRFILKV